MAKQKIKPGQIWSHNPTGNLYQVVSIGKIKIPHVGWFKSVTYIDPEDKQVYSRFREDWENKFTFREKPTK